MSVKLMSAIFQTEFRNLPRNDEGEMSKGSTIKLVMLAIADHANDSGESAYPGLTLLQKKTALTRQGLVNTLDACKYNGLLSVAAEPSRLGTNDYYINLNCFPCLKDLEDHHLLVNPLDYPSQATLPPVVNPVDLNHHLTTKEPKESTTTGLIFQLYEQNIGLIHNITLSQEIGEYAELPPLWLEYAFKQSADANARNWRYVRAVLDNCKASNGIPEKPKRNNGKQPKGMTAAQEWLKEKQNG